ncbi:hypothetical protein GCM10009712_20480 [Pseudarthrobacter sulfonivorans]
MATAGAMRCLASRSAPSITRADLVGVPVVTGLVGAGIFLTVAVTGLALIRAKHPNIENDQISIKLWEAWTSTMTINVCTFWFVLVLSS